MNSRLSEYLSRAGLTDFSPTKYVLILLASIGLIYLTCFGVTGSHWISGSVVVCLVAQCIEMLNARIGNLQEKQTSDWPKFLDAIYSAVWSGTSLQDAILDSRNYAPSQIKSQLAEFEVDLASGLSFEVSLENLKARVAQPIGDRFVEITRLAHLSGGRGYLAALRKQSSQLRLEISTWSEIRVKQNWVISTAKLALLAPWVVLLILGSRAETGKAFETSTGLSVLAIGLVASLLTFRLIKSLGKLPIRRRTLI
jgi:tight adherence protein B